MERRRASKRSAATPGELPRLYRDLAWIWPILSPAEDYRREALTLRRVCRELGVGAARRSKPTLLELGAGGGHLLFHLQRHFECTATDLSAAMLENCRRLVPAARRIRGDMRTLRLRERFDVVLIHDAIDYMRQKKDVREALATAVAHLAPSGVILLAPTYIRDNFVDGEAAHDASPSHGLTYLSYVHDPNPRDSEYELVLIYLIRDPVTRAVRSIEDRHRCGLFAASEWAAMLARAGLDGRMIEDDKAWTLFAAQRRR